jgi:hypothetical protein
LFHWLKFKYTQIQFFEKIKKSGKFRKNSRTNSEQISEDFFLKTTLFHWLKFKYIQIQVFCGNKKIRKICKKSRTNSEQIGGEIFQK